MIVLGELQLLRCPRCSGEIRTEITAEAGEMAICLHCAAPVAWDPQQQLRLVGADEIAFTYPWERRELVRMTRQVCAHMTTRPPWRVPRLIAN